MSFFSSFKKLLVISLSAALSISLLALPSEANEYSCLRSPVQLTKNPIWTTSSSKDLKFVVSWAFKDPENCIVGMNGKDEPFGNNSFRWDYPNRPTFEFPASWTVTRAGEMALVSAETEFPIPLLQALPNRNLDGGDLDLSQLTQKYDVLTAVKTRLGSGFESTLVAGKYGLAQLWGNWFSKNQGIFPDQCKPISPDYDMSKLNSKISWKITNPGTKPTVEISIQEDSNCIFLVHAGPLAKSSGLNKYDNSTQKSLAERPFWSGEAPPYFNQILSKPDQLVQVAVGDFASEAPRYGRYFREDSDTDIVETLPSEILSHSDSVIRDGQSVKVTTTIDGTGISSDSSNVITIYTGFYWWYSKDSSYTSAGWRVTYSGNSWTARYSSGGSLPGGIFMGYTTRAIKIPASDLFITTEAKAAAELKVKQEADSKAAAAKVIAEKAAAELKAKQEADAKAAAELKVKQDADSKAAAAKVIADKAVADLKAKQEADAKAVSNEKARAEIAAMDAELAKAKAATNKKTTITCFKGKTTKKVTAVKPVCPKGYKKK